MAMDDELSSGESSTSLTSRDDATIAADAPTDETPERPPLLQLPSAKPNAPVKEPSQTPRRPAFLSCKWPEGSDWAVALAGELETLGLPAVHDARHRLKIADVEALIRDSSCVILLITPGFYHALANKPPGNRALKEVKFALQYHKPLLAVLHASYCGQNPLPGISSWRELTTSPDDQGEGALPPPWTSGELLTVAAATTVLMFKGADGFDGYQRELVRLTADVTTTTSVTLPELSSSSPRASRSLDGGGGGISRRSGDGGGSVRSGAADVEAEERRLREVLKVAGLSRRLPGLLDAGINSLGAVEVALRRGRLSTKPLNWHETWERRLAQVLEAWPVLCSQPEWLRTAPEGLVPQLVALLAQEEAKEYDREGRARPRRGAVTPVTTLNLSGQGPVVMGHRGGVAVAALMRDVGSAMAGATRRRQELMNQQQVTGNGDVPPIASTAAGAGVMRESARSTAQPQWRLYGTGTTTLTLTTVNLTDCDLGTAAAAEVLSATSSCPCLETLLLGGNCIDDGIVRSFDLLMRKLSFDSKPPGATLGPVSAAVTPRSAATLGSIAAAAGLRTLGLERNHITDAGASEILSVAFSYPGALTSLDLSGNHSIGHSTAETYGKLLRAASDGGPQRLTQVNLIDTGLDESTLAALTPVLLTACRKTADGGGAADSSANPVDELDFSGITVDLEVLSALAAVSRMPDYRGGPRVMNLSGANLRLEPPGHHSPSRSRSHTHTGSSKRTTMSELAIPGERRTASGAGGSGSGCNVTTLASALLHSTKIEELRLGWCGLGGAGLRILVTGLMAAAGSTGTGPAPLSKLTLLDLTGNKLGPEGVTLLGALLPVNLPSLRHLILDECGFGGRELGILAGMLDVSFWVAEAVQGALCHILTDTITGGMRGIWTEPMPGAAARNARQRQSVTLGDDGVADDDNSGAAERLAALFQLWLSMDPSSAAAEVKRLLLPASAAAAARDPHYALRRASMALGAGDPSPLAGLGCLLVHPVTQPVLEALRNTMDALTVESEALRASGGPGYPVQLPLSTPAAQAAFRSLDAAVVHLRGCADVNGLQTLSLGRNGFAQEAGAPLGAAVALSSGLRYLGLRGIVQPPAPPPVVGSGAVAVAAAMAIVTGGPLGAAAAAARDTRFLLRRLHPQEAMALESGELYSLSGETSSNVLNKQHHHHHHHHHHNHHNHRNRRSTIGDSMRESIYGGSSLPPHAHPHAHLPLGLNSFANPNSSSPVAATSSQPSLPPDTDRKSVRRFLPGIRCLDLTDAGISTHNVANLAELACHLPLLEQLILDFNFLSSYPSSETNPNDRSAPPPQPLDATAAMFADLSTMPCLSYLSLNYACDAGAMMSLADFLLPAPPTHQASSSSIAPPSASNSTGPLPPPPSANLRVLSLVGCPLDGTVARRVARAFAHNMSLQVLRLGGGDPPEGVGPIGSRALSEALAAHRGLVELSLSGVGLTDNAARIFAEALPLLTSLCKLDLSYNSLTGYGINALATALLARNRNSIGAASENRLNMQVHGNRMSEELEARMQALSVPPAMTHLDDRMPVVPWYGPPPPRSAGAGYGTGYGGSSGGGGYFAASVTAAPVPASRGGAATGSPSNIRANLPAPPSLAPPPTLVRAPLPRQGPGTPLQASKSARCAWGSSRSNAGTQSQVLSAVPTSAGSGAERPVPLLTAVPPPPPARRGSDDVGMIVQPSMYADSVLSNNRQAYATSTSNLQKIYGANNMYLNGQRRSSPNGFHAHRPTSSPTIKAGLPMSIGQLRHGAPGAPYALSLLHASQNPLLSMNRKFPSRTGSGNGGGTSDAAANGHALPAVRKGYNANSSGGGDVSEGSDGEGTRVVNSPAANKVFGASEHLQQRIKCHQPDWVQRMQEDYYKRITSPPNPVSSAPPVAAPSEHLFKPLRCHDPEWQRCMQHHLTAIETAPEPHPRPVPGAPTTATVVSIVAAMQRGDVPLIKPHSPGEPRSPAGGATPPRRSASPSAAMSPARSGSPRPSGSRRATETPPRAVSPPPPTAATPPRVSEPSGDGAKQSPAADAPQAAPSASGDGAAGPEGGSTEDAVSKGIEESAAAAAVAASAEGNVEAGTTSLGIRESLEESIEVLAIRNTGDRRSRIEMVRIKTIKSRDPAISGPTMVVEGEGSEHDDEEGSEEEEDGEREKEGGQTQDDSPAEYYEYDAGRSVEEAASGTTYTPADSVTTVPRSSAPVISSEYEGSGNTAEEYRELLKGQGTQEANDAEAWQRTSSAQQDEEGAGRIMEAEGEEGDGQWDGSFAASARAGAASGSYVVEEPEEDSAVAAVGAASRASGVASAASAGRSSSQGSERGKRPVAAVSDSVGYEIAAAAGEGGEKEASGALFEGDSSLRAGSGGDD